MPVLFAQWEQTPLIEFKNKGQKLGSLTVESDNPSGRELMVPEILKATDFTVNNFEMIGLNSGKRVWRKVISFRAIPESFALLKDQQLEINLKEDLPNFVALYTEHAPKSEGWVLKDGTLKIGSGSHYIDNVHAETSAFVKLPAQAYALNFEAEIATEENYDFFKVIVSSEGKETELVKNTSGQHPMQQYTFDLSPFAGKKVELRFVFDSDAALNDAGVTIRNISLMRAL